VKPLQENDPGRWPAVKARAAYPAAATPEGRRIQLGLVGSSGGHLAQLMALRPVWQAYDRFWVTFPTEDARSLLAGERVYWCYHPTNRNLKNLIRNTWLAMKVLRKERPTHLISTGAAVAVPFFYVGRLRGARLIWIETFDRIDTPTLTGRIIHPITQHVLVQWPDQQKLYRRAEVIGPLF
jgi:UDP-N-acetylglucosamine:LPS N-acetylglucosamine transferase